MTEATVEPDIASSPELVALRRRLHHDPELRFAEVRTAALLAERLAALGFTVRAGVGGTGLVGTLRGDAPGPHVLIRADMDALPVQDQKSVAYASANAGITHACGHDVHATVVLGAAARLAAAGIRAGRLTILFQPAEERPFGQPSGAQRMLEDGALAEGDPEWVLGIHAWPDLPSGVVGVDERIAMGAKDAFSIAFRGRGAHAATPSRGRDAILAMASLVTALHAGVSRSLDASDRAAFNVGTIAGGRSQSVVPEDAIVTGTLRTVDPVIRGRLRGSIEGITAGVAAAHGVEPTLTWADEMPPIVNDPRLVRLALAVAARVLGDGGARRLTDPPMTADDFALFAERGRAMYLKLGVADPAAESWPPLHSGHFDVDERCIGVGVAVLAALAMELLAGAEAAGPG